MCVCVNVLVCQLANCILAERERSYALELAPIVVFFLYYTKYRGGGRMYRIKWIAELYRKNSCVQRSKDFFT